MSIDLNSLSAKQLDALISQAKKRKATLGKRKPVATVRQKLTALARAEGYTIAELFGTAGVTAPKINKTPGPRKGNKLGKVAPKYHNPANLAQTWAGRGMQPKWLATETGKGRALEEFLIK
jgi:DNA-binding protein H-NS